MITFTSLDVDDIRLGLPPGEYWFYNMKAERGTTATDWSSNPEDNIENYDNLINELNQQIIKFTDEIRVVESKVDK